MDLKSLTKKELLKLVKKINTEIKSRGIEVGDDVWIKFVYMIGDADGTYDSEIHFSIESEDHLNAIKILQNFIETEVMGDCYAKFRLDSYNLKNLTNKIPYRLFVKQEKAPSSYLGYEINEEVLESLYLFYDELFRSELDSGGLLLSSIKIKVI